MQLPEPDLKATATRGSFWIALFPFDSEYDEDLSLEEGDLIKITEYA